MARASASRSAIIVNSEFIAGPFASGIAPGGSVLAGQPFGHDGAGGPVDERLLAGRVAVVAGILVALIGLTRPDGVIYLAAYPAVVLSSISRGRVRAAGIALGRHVGVFLAVYAPYVVWRRFEFGRWVPNTAVAKAQAKPGTSELNRIAEVLQYPGLVVSVVAVAVVASALVATPGLRRPLTALLVPPALALIAYSVLNPDWMGQLRFATPIWPSAVLATAISAARLFALPGPRQRPIPEFDVTRQR